MFAARMPLSQLAVTCRSLGTMLHSGVSLLAALKVVEKQQHSALARRVIRQISDDIRSGQDLTSAIKDHGGYFPELMVDMVAVAEQTGSLPEVLAGLADHYENLVRLRRTFLAAIAWPMIQLVAAVFIVAGLILVLGWIAEASPQQQQKFDPLGFGLHGASGALTWLGYCFGSAAAAFVAYKIAVNGFRQARAVHSLLLTLPGIGACMRSFAIARFAWAFALTQQAGMEIRSSLESSLKATANGAFQAASPHVVAGVMAGEELADVLDETRLFPLQFTQMVRVGESSGTVPEALERLSPEFEEDARRSLSGLTAMLGWAIWALVAAMIVFIIFRLMSFYVDMINKAASGQF